MHENMGGGTFLKCGGNKLKSKTLQKMFVVWISNCDITSIGI